MKREVVAATNNMKKLKEIQAILEPYGFCVLSLKEAGIIHETVEDCDTFLGNALKKAKEIYKIAGKPTFADDSGLCVDALLGAPGVYSARYAGINASDDENIDKLLFEMKGKTDRSASFVSVVVFYTGEEDILTAEGSVKGRILEKRNGTGGFGYDPVFFCDQLQKTFAEADEAEKNKVSHRGLACARLSSLIESKH